MLEDGRSDPRAGPGALDQARTKAAADWWAGRLAHGTDQHDLGGRDEAERDLTATARAASFVLRQRFTAEQVEAFASELAERIEQHLVRWETYPHEGAWDSTNPRRGSALRAIHCDYCPHPVLADAAERAGFELKMFDLPMKTVMWINPGEVTVSEGYAAPTVVVWRALQAGDEVGYIRQRGWCVRVPFADGDVATGPVDLDRGLSPSDHPALVDLPATPDVQPGAGR